MMSDDSDIIECNAEIIAGHTWTKRTVSRELPLSEQLIRFIQDTIVRGPGEVEGPELERLMWLAEDASQLGSMGPATVSMDL